MSPSLINVQTFAELQANAGHEFVVELVETFAAETPHMLAELRTSFSAGAADTFRRAAHSLKSNSATFGANHLAELARSLELGGLPTSAAPIEALATAIDASVVALRSLAAGQAGASGG